MGDVKRGKRLSLSTIRDDIRGRLDAAKFTEERMIALDIKAQRLRAQAAMAFLHELRTDRSSPPTARDHRG